MTKLAWPLLAMLFAACTMTGSNLAMRWVCGRGGRAVWVTLTLFGGALAPLLIIYLLRRPALSPPALLFGAVAGGSALLASVSALQAMRHGKVGPTMLLLNMCAGAPVLLAALLHWDAALTPVKYLALGCALVAITLCSWRSEPQAGDASRLHWAAWAFPAFFLNGLNQSCQKLQAVHGLQAHALSFNLAYFVCGIAIALATAPLLARQSPLPAVRRLEWGVGAGFGLLIAAQMSCILYAVNHLPAAVAFPTLGILPLVLTTLGAGIMFRERLTRSEQVGMALACVSLVLLNVKG